MTKAEKEDSTLKKKLPFLELRPLHNKYIWSKENERYMEGKNDQTEETGMCPVPYK